MPMHRRMPVITTVERGRQFSRRGGIRIAVQAVTKLVRIFLVDARECQIRKPLGGIDVKTCGNSGRLSTPSIRGKKQEGKAKCGLHRAATLNEISAGLKRLQWPSGAFGFSNVMSCRAWHSVDGSNAAIPVNSSFEARNSSGGRCTLAGSPANLTFPSELVPASRSSLRIPPKPYLI